MCSVSCCKFSCARDLVPPPALHWGRCSHTCGKCIAPTNLEQLQDLVLADVGIGSENEIGATLGKWFRHFLQNSARTDANSVSELYEALGKPSWPVRCWKCGPCLHCSSTKCCRAGERVLFWDLCWINFVSLCICLCVGRLYHMAVVRWALLRVFLYTVWFTMYIPSIACRAPFDLFSWCSIRASCFCFQLFQGEHLFLDWIRNPRGSKGSSLVQPGSAWFSEFIFAICLQHIADYCRPGCLANDVALAAISDRIAYYAVPSSQARPISALCPFCKEIVQALNIWRFLDSSSIPTEVRFPPQTFWVAKMLDNVGSFFSQREILYELRDRLGETRTLRNGFCRCLQPLPKTMRSVWHFKPTQLFCTPSGLHELFLSVLVPCRPCLFELCKGQNRAKPQRTSILILAGWCLLDNVWRCQ